MKLTLVNPSRGKGVKRNFWDFDFEQRTFGVANLIPLALPTVAALTREDVDVSIVDENIEEIDFDEKADLVGIGAMTPNVTRAYEIADEFRQRNVKVAMGGIHASMVPEEASKHADSVIIGEAEYIWKDVIGDLQNGNLKKFYKATCHPNLEDSPAPRYDLVRSDKYVTNQVQTTRGCPFDCEFCTVNAFLGRQFRYKKIDQVLREIEALPTHYVINVLGHDLKLPKSLLFSDDNIIGNKRYAKELFQAFIPLKLSEWWCQASINVGREKELLALMKEAGCRSIIIGIESILEDSLQELGKRVNRFEHYHENIEAIQSFGIRVVGSFILGNDAEDSSIFEKTVKFIQDNDIVYNMINVLTPLPGTKLFKRLEREGRLLHKDWKQYDLESACFKPAQMSVEELEEGRQWVCQQVYSLDGMLARYRNFFERRNYREVGGYERSYGQMSLLDKLSTGLLTTKMLLHLKREERAFLLGRLKRFVSGRETDLGTAVTALSFHDYVSSLPINHLDPHPPYQ